MFRRDPFWKLIEHLLEKDTNILSEEELFSIQDTETVDQLIQGLKDKKKDTQLISIVVLGNTQSRRAVKPLIHILGNEGPYHREGAAIALEKLRDERAVNPLINALKDEDYYVREKVEWALVEIGSVYPLIDALNHKNRKIREGAARVLGGMQDERAAAALKHALEDDHEGVRQAAASALGRYRTSKHWSP
jgi:HEAT repeat protein